MKKFIFVFALLMSFVLTGCFANDTSVIGLSITKMPANTYVVNSPESAIELEITIYYSGKNPVSYNYSQAKGLPGLTISNIDFSKTGSRTATISFEGFTATFDYTVVASDSSFAGGDGSLLSPYLISNAQQFMAIDALDSTDGKYFKLINDIDMTGVESTTYPNEWGNCFIANPFRGTFDGNGHSMINLDKETDSVAIFGCLDSATVKNLVITESGSNRIAVNAGGTLLIDNVKMYGTFTDAGNNDSAFIIYLGWGYATNDFTSTNLTIRNCESHVDIITTGHKIAVFFGFIRNTAHVTMENCKNYGTLEAQQVAFLCANHSTGGVINVVNSSNEGIFTSVVQKGYLFANGTDPISLEGYNKGQVKNVPWLLTSNGSITEVDGKVVYNEISKQVSNKVIDHYKITITVPVVRKDGTATARPHIESVDLFVDSNNKIITDIFKNYQLTIVNGSKPEEVEGLYGCEWFAIVDGKFVFYEGSYEDGSYTLSTSETPYFAIYAYDASGILIAGCTKVSGDGVTLDSSFGTR